MAKYVEREALNDVIKRLSREPAYQHEGEDYYCGVCAVDGEIAMLSTADVVEVRHGEWITCCEEPRITNSSAGVSKFWFECSECGRKELHKEPYCHCGAKMDGKGEGE